MSIWAIADLHLAFCDPDKKMDYFGGSWINYTQKIEENWRKKIKPDDLVLLAGDLSWALKLEDAKIDFNWVDQLPGQKVMIKGNHDLWWDSISQLRSALPPSIKAIQNDIYTWNGIEIGGARLWDTPEYNYNQFVVFQSNPRAKEKNTSPDDAEKIFVRELSRLETSLKMMKGPKRIAMVHYPPLSADLKPSRASSLLEKYKINQCVFGHIHQVPPNTVPMGTKNGVTYHLTAADYLNFDPILIEI